MVFEELLKPLHGNAYFSELGEALRELNRERVLQQRVESDESVNVLGRWHVSSEDEREEAQVYGATIQEEVQRSYCSPYEGDVSYLAKLFSKNNLNLK